MLYTLSIREQTVTMILGVKTGMTRLPVRIVGPSFRKSSTGANLPVINTAAHSGWSSGLSPFLLGPCDLWNGHVSCNMENGWQYSKVYKQHIGLNGDPSIVWFDWAKKGWNNHSAVRYPMGKGKKPLYSWWDGERLGYIESRKRIYLHLYAKAVVRTEAFERLQKIYNEHEQIILWDYDGYDHLAFGMSLSQCLDNPIRIMGHAFVLAMLLEKHPAVSSYLLS